MTRFENRTLDKSINAVIIKANELLYPNSAMLRELIDKNDFKFNSGDGKDVVSKIVYCKKVAPIFFYKPFNRFSKAMGYSDGKAIYLNSRKFKDFSFNDLVGLLIHEYLHMVGFNHGNNYKTQEKCLYSVPYYLSENVSRWI